MLYKHLLGTIGAALVTSPIWGCFIMSRQMGDNWSATATAVMAGMGLMTIILIGVLFVYAASTMP